MLTPGTRLPNCTTTGGCATAGDGDSFIESVAAGANATAVPALEVATAFVHLNAADLVSGVNPVNGLTFGGQLPTVAVGGGMWVAHSNAVPTDTLLVAGRHYVVLAGSVAAVSDNGAMTGITAAQIDRKLDDGLPNTGSVQANGGTTCELAEAATDVYAENQAGGTCSLFIRALN